MSRNQKVKNLVYGLGALGGTVAIMATFLEQMYGDESRRKNSSQLNAQAHQSIDSGMRWDYNWDQREPLTKLTKEDQINNNSEKTDRPTASRHLILIRHGQYNLLGTNDEERCLTELGKEQARLTGLRLAELSLPFTSLARSDMTRALETAQIISQVLPSTPVLPPDSILREGSPIMPEPRVGSWRPDHYYQTDGIRIEAAFRKYFHRADKEQQEDSYEIIVCHANVIRYFVCRALQFPPEAWLRLSLRHASLTWLVIRPDGRVHCRALGEAGHFPPEKLTTT